MKSRFQTVISERMTQSTELATDQAKPHQSWIAATGAATTFILFSFWMSYSTWGHGGLPIGWDTPRYVYQSAIVASKGPIFFIQYNGFYNVVYQLLSGFIVWLGLPPLAVEVYMPIFICCTLPFLLSWITAQHYNKNLAALVALSTPAWPAIYRIGADLHPNLLALCLLLAALSLLFSHPKNLEIVSGIALICLASFTHIETTLFFVGIIALMGLFQRNSGSLLTYLMPAIATIPAAILYLIHFTSQVLSYSGGSASFSPPLSTDGWFLELGPLIPLVAIGIAICVISRQYWLEKLVATWRISSIVIGLSQYLSGQTTIFAERAIFLFPVPLAAAIGFNKLRTWPQKVGSLHREPNVRTIVMGLLLLLLVA